ncbi:MAG: TylF/MycF/NovP-related O-methyltransferase, partial [Ferrovibrio sp.]
CPRTCNTMIYSTNSDAEYKQRRAQLANQLAMPKLWEIADHWSLYCGIGNLARQLALIDILRESLNVPGHIAEFGVWNGSTTLLFAKLLRILDPHGSKVVHAFDSFEGLTEFDSSDGGATALAGTYKGSFERMKAFIDLYKLDDTISLHPVYIENTLPDLLQSQTELSFTLIYCDTDLHQSTSLILENLHPRLMKGGLVVFDEWNHPDYPGEGVAASEFMSRFGDKYEARAVPNARQPSLILKKIAY